MKLVAAIALTLTVAASGRADDAPTASPDAPSAPPGGAQPSRDSPAGSSVAPDAAESSTGASGTTSTAGGKVRSAPPAAADTDENGCFLASEWFTRPGRHVWSVQRIAGVQIDSLGNQDAVTMHFLYSVSRGASPFNLPMYGYDYVIEKRVTMGIAVGGLAAFNSGEGLYLEMLGRLGYAFPVAPRTVFWWRSGLGAVNRSNLLWFNLQADLVSLASDSFGVTLGATVDIPFADRNRSALAIGAMLGLLFYL